jgi:hypothetical protein
MTSDGWRSLMNEEWAGCVLHNLPFLFHKQEKKLNISLSGKSDSASNWNYFDFQEKMSRVKNIRST